MRKLVTISALLALALSLTGCDFLRHVAGRPDSRYLASKREAIEAVRLEEEARQKAIRDSVEAVRKHAADSVAAVRYFADEKVPVIFAPTLKGLRYRDFPNRYCIMIGVYSLEENVRKLEAKLKDAGYESIRIRYNSGKVLVGTCAGDDFGKVRADYERLRKEKFCPGEAWVFVKGDSL